MSANYAVSRKLASQGMVLLAYLPGMESGTAIADVQVEYVRSLEDRAFYENSKGGVTLSGVGYA